jgi:hypothetical protein
MSSACGLQVAQHLQLHEQRMGSHFREWLAAHNTAASAAAMRRAAEQRANEDRLERLAEHVRAANDAAVTKWLRGKAKQTTCKSLKHLDHQHQGHKVSEDDEKGEARVSALRRAHLQRMKELRQPAVQQRSHQRPWVTPPLYSNKPGFCLFSLPAQVKHGGVLRHSLFDLEPHQRPPALAFY